MFKEINHVITLMKNDKIVQIAAFVVIIISIVVSIFTSTLTGLLLFSNYILGFVICSLFIKYQTDVVGIVLHFINLCKSSKTSSENVQVCTICSGPKCNRHSVKNKTPWKHIHIQKKLNNAVEHFFNTILEQFIISWYQDFTVDKSFLDSLRVSIRYSSSIAVNKLLELQTGRIITNKLVPCAIKHIDDCLCIERIAKLKNIGIEKVAIKHLGRRLHVAATNRKNEVKYLREIASLLLPHLVLAEYLKCRNFSAFMRELLSYWVFLPLMDVIADPNIINSLVILITTYRSKDGKLTEKPAEMVEYLENFGRKIANQSPFAIDLKNILKNTELLYAFMQYLKKENCVHFLQFCLDLEEFNNKLLTADLSKHELHKLHVNASKFYDSYFSAGSSYFIGCDRPISAELRRVLDGGVADITRLRTSESLFLACDHVFTTLERDWLPHFYHSNEFYNYICRSKTSGTNLKNAPRLHGSPLKARNKRYTSEFTGQGTVAKISSGLGRIKGALQTKQPIDGSVYPTESSQALESDGATTYIEELSADCNLFRDMSAWRISIPIVTQQKYGSKLVFHINIQRVDTLVENELRDWTVQRKDQDFYTLKGKLIEFHGENEICNSPFPSRRSGTNHDIRKSQYETFLRNLLHKSFLRGSDLLHTFLTTNQDFTLLTAAVLPIMDLENIYQSVTYKLRKEKGQHLDTFMMTFVSSTEKSKNSKFDWAEISDAIDVTTQISPIVPPPKTVTNNIFNDNFGVEFNRTVEYNECSINPNGLSESIFYLLKHIFKVHTTILKLFAAICSIAQKALESFSQNYIQNKVKQGLSQENLTYLIPLLEEVIFTKHIPATSEELEERKRRAFKELNSAIPEKLAQFFGIHLQKGSATILEILQNPHLNKHLVYNLLDLILVEIYPELDKSSNTKK